MVLPAYLSLPFSSLRVPEPDQGREDSTTKVLRRDPYPTRSPYLGVDHCPVPPLSDDGNKQIRFRE